MCQSDWCAPGWAIRFALRRLNRPSIRTIQNRSMTTIEYGSGTFPGSGGSMARRFMRRSRNPRRTVQKAVIAIAASCMLLTQTAALAFSVTDFLGRSSLSAQGAPQKETTQVDMDKLPLMREHLDLRTGIVTLESTGRDGRALPHMAPKSPGSVEIGQVPLKLPPDSKSPGSDACEAVMNSIAEHIDRRQADLMPTSTPMDTRVVDASGNGVITPYGAALEQAQTVLGMQKNMKPLFETAVFEALGGIFNSGFTLQNLSSLISSAISAFLSGSWGSLIAGLLSKALDWGMRYIIDHVYTKAMEKLRGSLTDALNKGSDRMFGGAGGGVAGQQASRMLQGLAGRYGINANSIASGVFSPIHSSYSSMSTDPESSAYIAEQQRRQGKPGNGYYGDPNIPNPARPSGGWGSAGSNQGQTQKPANPMQQYQDRIDNLVENLKPKPNTPEPSPTPAPGSGGSQGSQPSFGPSPATTGPASRTKLGSTDQANSSFTADARHMQSSAEIAPAPSRPRIQLPSRSGSSTSSHGAQQPQSVQTTSPAQQNAPAPAPAQTPAPAYSW